MNESLRELLIRGADTVEHPDLDVADLVAQAQHRLVRRRLGVVAASAAAVAVVAAGGLALRQGDGSPTPAPPAPAHTSKTPDAKPELGPAIYFDALAVDGNALTAPAHNVSGPKDIYLTHEDGTTRQLVATGANEHCPRVSPEGDMLAYLAGSSVVVRRLDADGDLGTTTARVDSGVRADAVTCPQWSPDGQRVAVAVSGFDNAAYEQTLEVRVIAVDGAERLLATQQAQWMPPSQIAWSPDGDAIAYTTPDSVWVAPLHGTEKMVWQGREPSYGAPGGFPPYPGKPERISWLATGELAVGAMTEVDGQEALHIVDPGSGHDQVLATFPKVEPATWTWSPDGSRMVSSDDDGRAQLFDRASGTTLPVRPRFHRHQLPIWGLTWSADGRRLLGTAADTDPSSALFALVSMDPDGSSVKVMTPWTLALYSAADASWSPR